MIIYRKHDSVEFLMSNSEGKFVGEDLILNEDGIFILGI